ncbi:hypothetical protein BSL78_21925 [Apostichopus japonicus]|uniref:CCHC-type domain-containing protein n=1 Tax=Stichopus japonicus TaxID=307972 RepID=A0A2G8JZP3_STIJA|nr:hypothetical protein BSL78_21925 [Apostichopus japonicus]
MSDTNPFADDLTNEQRAWSLPDIHRSEVPEFDPLLGEGPVTHAEEGSRDRTRYRRHDEMTSRNLLTEEPTTTQVRREAQDTIQQSVGQPSTRQPDRSSIQAPEDLTAQEREWRSPRTMWMNDGRPRGDPIHRPNWGTHLTALSQKDKTKSRNDERLHWLKSIKCWNCGETGHFRRNCPMHKKYESRPDGVKKTENKQKSDS